jgi:hypothetical protein
MVLKDSLGGHQENPRRRKNLRWRTEYQKKDLFFWIFY